MKPLSNVFLIILLLGVFGFREKKDKPSSDMRIDQLVDSLPSNWYVKYSDTLITFVCRDSVYRVWNNKINADVRSLEMENSEEKIMESLKKDGTKKEGAFLSFRLQKKWTDAQIKKANAANQKTYKQIKALPSKHKIEHLYDAFASHKGVPTYRGKTDDDKKRIAAYEAEKAVLEKKVIKFPDYCSSDYSIFTGRHVGMDSAYEDIYPSKVSQQAYHIVNLANELWDCNYR